MAEINLALSRVKRALLVIVLEFQPLAFQSSFSMGSQIVRIPGTHS